MKDVLFEPWADNMYSSDPDSEDCSLTDRNSTRNQIGSLCNDKHTCLLNNSLDYFSLACPYIERKVNITYRCGEFSHNCNTDTCIYYKNQSNFDNHDIDDFFSKYPRIVLTTKN